MAKAKTSAGKEYPLGSTYDGSGVNFALFSANATKIEVCLFNESGSEELKHHQLKKGLGGTWNVYIPGLKPGQVYGYRVYGPYDPNNGHRFNHHKLLTDPYGKKLVGKLIWHKALFGYDIDNPSPDRDLTFSTLDSAPYVPKSVVVDDSEFDWSGDVKPNIPFDETIVYEAHVRGYTKLHPKVPDSKRGTFAGMAEKSITSYLKWLGVSSVELLPIHAFFGNRHKNGYIVDNYWGYESFSFFAPEQSYLCNDNINEFKEMVKAFHKEGLEVFLDVVYNHTGEGNHFGPTLCYRGIDNASYYTLHPQNKRYYYDSTGVGASFNAQNPNVLRLIMDSLRYWVKEMHVDGFRFDLASSLCRQNMEFKQESGFMYATTQDDILRSVKLIAEPWDVSLGGYQVGAFWSPWAEWNDRYRDTLRRFWKGDEGQIGDIGYRLSGSSDIFMHATRDSYSSINFVTAHDGFCLNDLVSYNHKHNMGNGENNRDGSDNNWSWNSGAEGETDKTVILDNRYARMRALLTTLFCSLGTPMMLAGDEFARSQFGNNNPYCQDNILTWIAWEAIDKRQRSFARFVRKLIQIRKKLPEILARGKFYMGKPIDRSGVPDISWFNEKGEVMKSVDWTDPRRKSILSYVYTGKKSVCLILNANYNEIQWKIPKTIDDKNKWNLLLDSSLKFTDAAKAKSGGSIKIPAWSVLLFEVA